MSTSKIAARKIRVFACFEESHVFSYLLLMKLYFVLVVNLLGFVPVLQAELPPRYYLKLQQKASEVVYIKVLDVTKEFCLFSCSPRKITIRAKVLQVKRTSGALEKIALLASAIIGMIQPICLNPKAPGVLQDSEQTIAYLDYDSKKNVYNLAAFGFSFEEIPHR